MIRSVERFVALTMVLTMLLCAVGCTQPTPDESTPTITPNPPSQITQPSKAPSEPTRFTEPVESFIGLEIDQQRLPGYDKSWIARFHQVFGQEFVAVNDPQELQDALDRLKISLELTYDQEFFMNNRLVLIPMQSGSGSQRYYAEASEVFGEIEISVGAMPMEVGTADMADWLLLIPLSRVEFPEKLSIVVNLPVNNIRNDDLPVYDQ